MPKFIPDRYTINHQVMDDGSLEFECSTDQSVWPWLALPPHDPIVVQTINYWAPVETGETRGTFDRNKWTALTQTRWTSGEPDVGHAVHGIAKPVDKTQSLAYDIAFYDQDDRLVYDMHGTGVVFQNRDFEGWRAKAKQAISALPQPPAFEYAPAQSVGLNHQSESFLSPLKTDDTPTAQGLITSENGFVPAHRHITGSGDHINATHLADIGLQFARLVKENPDLYCASGKISFHRFVELDYPFDVALIPEKSVDKSVAISVHQAGKLCADMILHIDV